MNNQRRILNIARELFNQRGIKPVTARVICSELSISPGSFSYHFPDRKTLVRTLFQEMNEEMKQVMNDLPNDKASILFYLETHRLIFLVQQRYRFFFINLAEILREFPEIKSQYQQQCRQENLMARQMTEFYIAEGVLSQNMAEDDITRLINIGQILNRFWALDAEIHPIRENLILHYMTICCGMLEPYLSPNSLQAYHQYFREMRNGVPTT